MTDGYEAFARTDLERLHASNSHMRDAPHQRSWRFPAIAHLAEVQRYIEAVEQERLAEAAMAKRSKAVRLVTNAIWKG